MTDRKRWWRMAALAVVGGGMVTGGWYRLVRATPAEANAEAAQVWTAAAPAPQPATPPAITEVERSPEAAPPAAPVTPAGGVLPAPELNGGTVAPVIPIVPVSGPPVAAPAMPALAVPAIPPVEPVSTPRQPDAELVPADKGALPAVPAISPAGLPALPVPPKPQASKPATPAAEALPKPSELPLGAPPMPALPSLPALPGGTAEPPKATPSIPPMPSVPMPPVSPTLPQPAEVAPSAPPVKPADPVQPASPVKPDSGLNVPKPGNTLNPTVPALPPITPPTTGGAGRETPGTPVDRAKPLEPGLGSSDKFVFPVPAVPNPLDSHPRDDTMHKLTATAAFAVLSGALLGAEKAAALPPVTPPPGITAPGALVKADDKTDVAQLKDDLKKANEKIKTLEEQVAKLTELIKGKKDPQTGTILPSDPGAVAEIKQLKDTISKLEGEIKSLRSTSLKPSVGTPETKPTGTVKIINEYPVEISIVVNDKSYHVAPSKVLDVEVPAGEFTYQLLTAGAPATKSPIKKGETVRLRIK
jgi:predicted transcriptional regulator